MTCVQARTHLREWPEIRAKPGWSRLVRHTWECRDCLRELVAVIVLAERVRVAVEGLPKAPPAVRWAVLGTQGATPPQDAGHASAWARLDRARPYLPPAFRLVTDPLALVARWLPDPLAP